MSVLSRSRLEAALKHNSLGMEVSKRIFPQPPQESLDNYETIQAAIEHLLNPKATNEMVAATGDGWSYAAVYRAMISELTKETPSPDTQAND